MTPQTNWFAGSPASCRAPGAWTSPRPEPHFEVLGKGVHQRCRYTDLRPLLEREHRYCLLSLGWDPRTDPTYVIEDDDTIRIDRRPGVLPLSGR